MKRDGFGTGLMYVILVLLTVGLGFLVFFNYRANMAQKDAIQAAQEAALTTPTPPPTTTPEPTAEPTRTTKTVTLALAGDLVGHERLTSDAAVKSEDEDEDQTVTYDFSEQLKGISRSLEQADLAACTLVSTVSENGDYGAYNMPSAVADALSGVGFDLVNVATDHILDREISGLTKTVDILHKAGLGVMGAYSSNADKSVPMATVNDMKVAFLSYTYSTAGTGSQPASVAENSWCLDILTTDYMTEKKTVDYEKIDADIAAVREAGADIVVCYVYWWDNTQYYTEPRPDQTEVVDHLCQSGADIIVGGGVKVPQPIEVRTVEREDGSVANCVVCYSLSNLMSCFNDNYTDISAVVKVELSRDVDSGETWVSGVSTHPLFMLNTDAYDGYISPDHTYKLLDAADETAIYENGGRDTLTDEAYAAAKQGIEDIKTLMGSDYAEEYGGVRLGFPYEAQTPSE